MISVLRMLLATITIPVALSVRVPPEARAHGLGGRLHVRGIGRLAAVVARTESVVAPPRQAAGASSVAGDDFDEADPHKSVGRFLVTLRKAIPWAVGLALLVALAVVVVTCWLRKGILAQNLVTSRGRMSTGKQRDTREAAAKYLAKMEERQAADREPTKKGHE